MVDLAGMVADSFPSDRKIYDCVIIIGNSVKKIKEVCQNHTIRCTNLSFD